MTLDVQHNFRQTLSCGEKFVGLKTCDACESEDRVCLGQCNDIVRNRINPKLPWVVVLHDKRIAELREIGDSVDVFSKICPVLETKTIPAGRNILTVLTCLIEVWILILDVKRFYLRLAAIILAVIDRWLEADCRAAAAIVIKPEAGFDMIRDWKGDLGQK